nr:hypothetical protein [Streptomyces sp. AC602_WCS936]
MDVAALWSVVEEVTPRAAVMTAAATVVSLVPEDENSAEVAMRAVLANQYATVRPFLSLLGESKALDAASAGTGPGRGPGSSGAGAAEAEAAAADDGLPARERVRIRQPGEPLTAEETTYASDSGQAPPERRAAIDPPMTCSDPMITGLASTAVPKLPEAGVAYRPWCSHGSYAHQRAIVAACPSLSLKAGDRLSTTCSRTTGPPSPLWAPELRFQETAHRYQTAKSCSGLQAPPRLIHVD